MIRLAAVDLDGTLLRSDGTVSAGTVDVLARTRAAGVRIVIVTARPPRFVREIAAETGLTGVAVCANGAMIHDLGSGRTDILHPLPLPLAERAAGTIATLVPEVAFAIETGFRALVGPGRRGPRFRDSAVDVAGTEAELWAAPGCVKLLARSPAPVTGELLDRVRRAVPEVEVTYSGGAGLLEISAPGVSKVDTLARLCAEWEIAPAEVIAFGDMPNDLPVLRWAGTAVAVANAHPDVLAIADRVTHANDDDGVARVLDEIGRSDPDGVRPAETVVPAG